MNPPDFIIGVEQQPEENFGLWKSLGVNTLSGIAQGRDPAAWVKAANAAGLYQIRPPVGDPSVDAGNPLLLAWSFPDEPDLKKIPVADLKAMKAASAAADTVRKVPWRLNLSGGYVLNLVAGGPTDAQYRDYLEQADWVSHDLFPVAGWDNAIGLFTPTACIDKLRRLDPWNKPHLMYVECARQGLANLRNGGRSTTVAEMQLLIHQARAARCRGIIYFPLQVESGFQWDATTPEIKMEIIRQNHLLIEGASHGQ